MIEVLEGLIGSPPQGLEFLVYLFAFGLVLLGILCVAYVAHLPLEWIGSFHRKR